jgi:hypothetical protein
VSATPSTSSTPGIDPRKIEYVPLDALVPDPRNPKAHDQDVIDASIGRFGVLDLIVRDERTGFIVSGHGRAKVLSRMRDRGETAPEGVRLGADPSDWLIPVVTGWASRTDTEAAAALIALNRTTELGGWVDDELLSLLDELSDADAMTGVGFTDDDRERLQRLRDATAVFDGDGDGPLDKFDLDAALRGYANEDVDSFKRVIIHCADEPAYDRLMTFIGNPPGRNRAGAMSYWYGTERPTSVEHDLVGGAFDDDPADADDDDDDR